MLVKQEYFYHLNFPNLVLCVKTEKPITGETSLVAIKEAYKLLTIEKEDRSFQHYKLKSFDSNDLEGSIDNSTGEYLLNINDATEILGITKFPDFPSINQEELIKLKQELHKNKKV